MRQLWVIGRHAYCVAERCAVRFARQTDIFRNPWVSPHRLLVLMEGEAEMDLQNKSASQVEPWNKGKLMGAKPPLRPKHVWAVRARLQLTGRLRDLALFNLAIDSKLRGCDVVSLKKTDVAPHGYAADRASVRQRKTGRPVRFEITEQTRQAVDDYLSQRSGVSDPYLFPGRGRPGLLSTRQYARLLEVRVREQAIDAESLAGPSHLADGPAPEKVADPQSPPQETVICG